MYDLDIFTDGSCQYITQEKREILEKRNRQKITYPLTSGWGGFVVPKIDPCVAYWGNQKADNYDSTEAELIAIFKTLNRAFKDGYLKSDYNVRLFTDNDRVYLLFALFLKDSGILLQSDEIDKQSLRGLKTKVKLEEVNLLLDIGHLCYKNSIYLQVLYPLGIYQKQVHNVCHAFAKCCSRIKVFNRDVKEGSRLFQFYELQGKFFAEHYVMPKSRR